VSAAVAGFGFYIFDFAFLQSIFAAPSAHARRLLSELRIAERYLGKNSPNTVGKTVLMVIVVGLVCPHRVIWVLDAFWGKVCVGGARFCLSSV
jgi:hypothetical protein